MHLSSSSLLSGKKTTTEWWAKTRQVSITIPFLCSCHLPQMYHLTKTILQKRELKKQKSNSQVARRTNEAYHHHTSKRLQRVSSVFVRHTCLRWATTASTLPMYKWWVKSHQFNSWLAKSGLNYLFVWCTYIQEVAKAGTVAC